MFKRISYLTVILLVVFTSMSFAQSTNLSIALKSSYFGDQSNDSHRLTAIDDPLSIGFQLRYFPRSNFALQFSAESLNGKTREKIGEELNVQASLSALVYPIHVGKISPYLTYGLIWVQHNNSNENKSNSEVNFQTGIGTDIAVLGNLIYSVDAKIYSDGLNYLGWGTSFSIGYKF